MRSALEVGLECARMLLPVVLRLPWSSPPCSGAPSKCSFGVFTCGTLSEHSYLIAVKSKQDPGRSAGILRHAAGFREGY